jgi:glycosyltransferase involved in cell wall biosynthesis
LIAKRKLKLALISVGLGRVRRGFERWATDLFDVLRDERDLDPVLYGSRWIGLRQQVVPPLLRPMTYLVRRLPLGLVAGAQEYKRDCIAYAACLIPELIRRRFDLIHVVDPPLAVSLTHLRHIVSFRGRLLFTEGCAVPPVYYPRVDHIHHVSRAAYDRGMAAGVPAERMSLVPSGIHTDQFTHSEDRSCLRRKYGIAESTFVVLVVSAVKSEHKRVHHAIKEVSGVPGDVLLWIDGNPEDPEVPVLAQRLLGNRCRITHVAGETLRELYGLADVMVHAALEESFGLSIIEALCSGLPVLTHNAPHFEWLVEDADCLLDMSQPGVLAARLRQLAQRRDSLAEKTHQRTASVRQRFEWRLLGPRYAEMYRKVAAMGGADLVGSVRPLLASRRRLERIR